MLFFFSNAPEVGSKVLERHIPEVSTQNLRYTVGDPTASEKIIFSCVAFMTDVLTVHGKSEFEARTRTPRKWKSV